MFIDTRVSGAHRTLIVLIAALLTVFLAWSPADAKKKKKKKVQRVERTEEADYVGATGFRGVQDSPCVEAGIGCAKFTIQDGEKFVAIELVDAAGEPVWASVYINGYSDGTDYHEHVCGSSEDPFKLAPGLTELVVVTTQTTGGATNPCPGAATSGTVTATFSNIP